MIAFKEKAYGEMVVHASPINVFCIIMVPLSLLGDYVRQKVASYFTLVIFWGENLIFMAFFLVYEMLLMPILYFQITFNIGYSTKGMFTTVFNLFCWCCVGILYMPGLLFSDAACLCNILSMHEGCIEYQAKAENNTDKLSKTEGQIEEEKQNTIARMNEIREVIMKQYDELANKIKQTPVDDD